mmetsp:Transcript_43802/g.93170  ORF Transcript_43802/g.93170 Transcript_43802/m.93170 type:complete len:293 (-) Transcript_43802:1164-2042(-)
MVNGGGREDMGRAVRKSADVDHRTVHTKAILNDLTGLHVINCHIVRGATSQEEIIGAINAQGRQECTECSDAGDIVQCWSPRRRARCVPDDADPPGVRQTASGYLRVVPQPSETQHLARGIHNKRRPWLLLAILLILFLVGLPNAHDIDSPLFVAQENNIRQRRMKLKLADLLLISKDSRREVRHHSLARGETQERISSERQAHDGQRLTPVFRRLLLRHTSTCYGWSELCQERTLVWSAHIRWGCKLCSSAHRCSRSICITTFTHGHWQCRAPRKFDLPVDEYVHGLNAFA